MNIIHGRIHSQAAEAAHAHIVPLGTTSKDLKYFPLNLLLFIYSCSAID